MADLEKNRRIGDTRRATKARRDSMLCRSFKFKIYRSSLTALQREQLKMMFVEAKWIYNYLLSHQEGLFEIKTKYKELNQVVHFDKDKNEILSQIQYVGSSIKQELIQTICDEIKGLAASKRKGRSVGALKFKSEMNCIGLKQYGITHEIRGSKIKIQGIKKPVRVCGLKQLSKFETIEYASAKLLYDGYDYWIALTVYIVPENKEKSYKNDIIGLDLGVATTITCSNGEKISVSVEESERLKHLQAKLARQVKGSNNWYHTKSLLRKEYNHITHKKDDICNQVVHKLLNENRTIVMQDEQIYGWKSDFTSSKIQHSILGRVKTKLKSSNQVVILSKWIPTTQYCAECGNKYKEIKLSERVFVCPVCGATSDRDIHAANNMIYFYQTNKDAVGTTDTSKPVRKKQETTSSLVML